MALGDYTYWLRPQVGDTTPHDELGLAADLTGGTITLVDDGAGGKAWRFVGQALASGPSYLTAPTSDGGGCTVAIEMRVITQGGATGDPYAGYRVSGSSPSYGSLIAKSSTTAVALRHRTSGGLNSSAAYTHGAGWVTYVIKLKMAAAATSDQTQGWTTGGSGHPTPDLTSTAANIAAQTLSQIECGNASATIEIRGFATWAEELSDANCATLAADGLAATLDGGGGGGGGSIAAISNYYRMMGNA